VEWPPKNWASGLVRNAGLSWIDLAIASASNPESNPRLIFALSLGHNFGFSSATL